MRAFSKAHTWNVRLKTENISILIVEDDEELRTLLGTRLGEDGLSLCRKLRDSSQKLPNIPIIITSAKLIQLSRQ